MKYRGDYNKRLIMQLAYCASPSKLARKYGWRNVRVACKDLAGDVCI